jgi:metallo-beta-lactamase family protein
MMSEKISVRFLGAAGTVTGSKYLIETGNKKILVDCGLFQGLKELRLLNWEPLPFDVSSLDYVLLTHGHLDHVGYLPLLIKQGFKGLIHCTDPTVEITKLILKDSAKIQEEDAERANKYQYSKHHPAKPLYTTEEAEKVFSHLQGEPLDQWIVLDKAVSFRFQYAGHILGAVFIELKINGKLLVFSGDLGRPEDPLLFSPSKPKQADVLFMESTYGARIHKKDPSLLLMNAINSAIDRDGVIIIPSFAVERTQLIMYHIWELSMKKLIPEVPVYMDSPMGTEVLSLFKRNHPWHKLDQNMLDELFNKIKLITKPEQTYRLAQDHGPKIIIAASGMATGGRVLTYFEHFLGDEKATVLLVGFQGEGTRGRALLDGAQEIKMRGKFWAVRAKIELIEGLSAHADQPELIGWLGELENAPDRIFIVHGEKEGAESLEKSISETYGYACTIPQLNEIFEL